jgi:IclR family mhp operon transcriptional activator
VSSYKFNRSLHRGFEVLSALNRFNGSGVARLSELTGIHRTTIYRILETLQQMNYVTKGDSRDNYYLTLKVRQLSDGFNDEAWITSVGAPILRQLHRKVLWPTNIATFDHDAMVIRESSHRYSPFAVQHAVVGQRVPMMRTALGRAYLAFCPDAERKEIMRILRSLSTEDSPGPANRAYVTDFVRKAREDHYASSAGEKKDKTAAIAVPVMCDNRVIACINLIFFSSAFSTSRAAQEYLWHLREAAASIAKAYDRPAVVESLGSNAF